MWLIFARDGKGTSDGVEQALFGLHAIAQFTAELRARLGPDGVEGFDGALGVYRRLKGTLDAIPASRIEEMRADIAAMEEWLRRAARALDDLARLKQALGE
jgi:hypothetical protein